ncbi:MAG: hypothetical protein ACTTJJ_04110 [Prevotella fusca]|uniref:hypothetical protein n=1 Tax=Prevotella fusca TaxID=589436 RepID=UPI003FA088F4
MNTANYKPILLLLTLLFQVFTAKAQDNFVRLHGTYKGTASTELIKEGGNSSSTGVKKFQVVIEKTANDTKLILKDYKLGTYTFEDIVFDNLTATYQPENKRWKFTFNPLSGDYVNAKGTAYSLQLHGSLIGSNNYIYDNGTIEFTFEIYNRPESKTKNVYKGKNDVAAGISSVATKNNKDIVYDLYGRRVQNPRKGLYIINGKKVLLNNK